jgi:hypothetical protein
VDKILHTHGGRAVAQHSEFLLHTNYMMLLVVRPVGHGSSEQPAGTTREGSPTLVSQQVQPVAGNKIHRLARMPHRPSGRWFLRGSVPRGRYRTGTAMATKEMSWRGFMGGEVRVNDQKQQGRQGN